MPEVSKVRSIDPVCVTIAPVAAVINGFVIVTELVQERELAKEYSPAAQAKHVAVPPIAYVFAGRIVHKPPDTEICPSDQFEHEASPALDD